MPNLSINNTSEVPQAKRLATVHAVKKNSLNTFIDSAQPSDVDSPIHSREPTMFQDSDFGNGLENQDLTIDGEKLGTRVEDSMNRVSSSQQAMNLRSLSAMAIHGSAIPTQGQNQLMQTYEALVGRGAGGGDMERGEKRVKVDERDWKVHADKAGREMEMESVIEEHAQLEHGASHDSRDTDNNIADDAMPDEAAKEAQIMDLDVGRSKVDVPRSCM